MLEYPWALSAVALLLQCPQRGIGQRKDTDLPSFLLHVLDSTGFGESEEVSSWGKGELENKVRVREQLRMDICGWVSQAAAE